MIPEEEDFEIPIQELHSAESEAIGQRMAQWKKTRDMPALAASLHRLHSDAKKGDRFNLMPPIIDAVKRYATAGEVIGTIRMARGLSYDPFNMIDCPYSYN